ncbi:unnamed protein product [Prorocentrum cordatum]|nr:unnamed protein product [Polarella glacialis]
MKVGTALSGFGAPLLWLGLLVPVCAKGFGNIRGSIHNLVGNVIDKVPVVGTSWAHSIADVVTSPLQCGKGDGLAKSLFLTGSNTSLLAAGLGIGCLGVQGLGVQEWTQLSLPLLLVLALRPFLQRVWMVTGLSQEGMPAAADKPKYTFGFDDFLRTVLFAWAITCAGFLRSVQPVAALLGVFGIMSLRGMVSFKDIDEEQFGNLTVFASLVVLSGGIGSVYMRLGGFLANFLRSAAVLPSGLHTWALIAAYLGLRRFFARAELHVATLLPTFAAALAHCGMSPGLAIVTLALTSNLGASGQSAQDAFMRYVEVVISGCLRRVPWLVVALPVLGAFVVELIENRSSVVAWVTRSSKTGAKKVEKKVEKKAEKEGEGDEEPEEFEDAGA